MYRMYFLPSGLFERWPLDASEGASLVVSWPCAVPSLQQCSSLEPQQILSADASTKNITKNLRPSTI